MADVIFSHEPRKNRAKSTAQLYVYLARVDVALDEYHWDWNKAVNHICTRTTNPIVPDGLTKRFISPGVEAASICGLPAYYLPVGSQPSSHQWGNYTPGQGTACPHCAAIAKEHRVTKDMILSFYSPSLLQELSKVKS
jgi:hypothetical protein